MSCQLCQTLPQEGENWAFAAVACSLSLIPPRIDCPCCASTHKPPKFIAHPRLWSAKISWSCTSQCRGDNTTKYLSWCWEGCGLVPLWCALTFFFSMAQKLEGKCHGKPNKFSALFSLRSYRWRHVHMSVCDHTAGQSSLLTAAPSAWGQIVLHACESQQYKNYCTTATFPLWWVSLIRGSFASWAVSSAKTPGEHSNWLDLHQASSELRIHSALRPPPYLWAEQFPIAKLLDFSGIWTITFVPNSFCCTQ